MCSLPRTYQHDAAGYGEYDEEGKGEYPPVERYVVGILFEPTRHEHITHGHGKEESHKHHTSILPHEHHKDTVDGGSVYTAHGNLATAILGLEEYKAEDSHQRYADGYKREDSDEEVELAFVLVLRAQLLLNGGYLYLIGIAC